MNNIGKTIQHIRDSKAISQRELSQLSKIPQATISKIENNTTKINIETLEKIANALNISSFKILYMTALEKNDISKEKMELLKKLQPLIEKLDLTLAE